MKIVITSESTCDLPKSYIEENGIVILPLAINFGTEQHLDGVDITTKDIFEKVEAGSPLPKTSAMSTYEYTEFFNKIKSEHNADIILHIGFSSGLSSTIQNAISASKELENVYVVDSKNLSSGHGLVIMTAVDLIKQGLSIDKVIEEVEKIVPKVRTSFVINTMTYLNKGGRCSTIAMIAGSILQIKPSIIVNDGKMIVGKKYRGPINVCVKKYIEETLSEYPDARKDKIFLTYSSKELLNIEEFKNILKERGFENIIETIASPTISTHCGPNTIGILFIDK